MWSGAKMGGQPKSPDARKVIRVLTKDYGWVYDDNVGSSAHPCGYLRCGQGCHIVVYKTGNNTATALWATARKCPHGMAPAARHW
jgi:hypothetical protein